MSWQSTHFGIKYIREFIVDVHNALVQTAPHFKLMLECSVHTR